MCLDIEYKIRHPPVKSKDADLDYQIGKGNGNESKEREFFNFKGNEKRRESEWENTSTEFIHNVRSGSLLGVFALFAPPENEVGERGKPRKASSKTRTFYVFSFTSSTGYWIHDPAHRPRKRAFLNKRVWVTSPGCVLTKSPRPKQKS